MGEESVYHKEYITDDLTTATVLAQHGHVPTLEPKGRKSVWFRFEIGNGLRGTLTKLRSGEIRIEPNSFAATRTELLKRIGRVLEEGERK